VQAVGLYRVGGHLHTSAHRAQTYNRCNSRLTVRRIIRRVSTDASGPDGLRERKKRRTRQEISDVATRLFAEHGFERVTLSQIAEAADVSVKTIFNHFGSKEDLYFDRADELRASLVATIAGRPAGTTVLGALRALLVDNLVPFPGVGWRGLEEPTRYEEFRRFMATQDASPALRARRLTLSQELAGPLAEALAAALRPGTPEAAIRTLAAMLVAALLLRDGALRAAVAAGAPPRAVRRRVTAEVEEAFGRLEVAFGDLDEPT
jgi:AcrR family transcriptional regulator